MSTRCCSSWTPSGEGRRCRSVLVIRARYGPAMKSARLLLAVLAAGVSVVPSALAHHTVANSCDVSKIVVLKGVVTSVMWENPHVVYPLAVRGGEGSPVDWAIESRHLQECGMTESSVTRSRWVTP